MVLSSKSLSSTPELVSVPTYDRSKVYPGILHIGVGNFHRAHMAAYVDEFLNSQHVGEEEKYQWGIVGAGIMSFDSEKRQVLQSQDWLQTLVERDRETERVRIIGSMVDFLPVEPDKNYEALQKALLSPNIKIVSMTVTEGGYFLDSSGSFDLKHPDVVEDAKRPESPRTIFGMMVRALKKRRQAGLELFTILSCDNIPLNGNATRNATVGLASLSDPDLAQWIRENVSFPNSIVDRITPRTSDVERKYVRQKYSIEDSWPIVCEPFRQWVLEDKFSQGRPSFDALEGVKLVPDVLPYEKMKLRILNGGHAALCYPAALLGIEYVHQAMEHPIIGPFLDTLQRKEIIPTVPPVPDVSLQDYWTLIAKRFSNPTVNDTIERNCNDGSSRQPKFIISVASDGLRDGHSIDGLALVSAFWCRYCQGETMGSKNSDPKWDRLHATACLAATDPSSWLAMTEIYGSLGENPRFSDSFALALNTIQSEGVEAAMKKYIEANA